MYFIEKEELIFFFTWQVEKLSWRGPFYTFILKFVWKREEFATSVFLKLNTLPYYDYKIYQPHLKRLIKQATTFFSGAYGDVSLITWTLRSIVMWPFVY